MSKISIGLRGWRFDEDAVFDEEGNVRPIEEMDEDTRSRLLRMNAILGEPCGPCWLIHGDENIQQANTASIVYGEPLAEVVLCREHEADFLYWFREEGGDQYIGRAAFQDEFHEWFADGNRAPEGYEGLEYVEEAPEDLPEPEVPESPEESEELTEVREQVGELDEEEREAMDLNLDDLDV